MAESHSKPKEPTDVIFPVLPSTELELPITIHELLKRSPYAIRALTEKQVGRARFPDVRVESVVWRCFHKDKEGKECKRVNVFHRGQCISCKQTVRGDTNIFLNANRQPIKWGDDLNMMPGRLTPKWWECKSCGHFLPIADSTVGESRCAGCEVDGITSTFDRDCWMWNEFSERLALVDGSVLLEMGPWLDTIWAYNLRKKHTEDIKIVV